ncbi:MAG: methyltransferase domain-containing protein [Planctomycetes bacterium]|nr:methyltransferase domain-containing protein [Planctomycetota bacterium]
MRQARSEHPRQPPDRQMPDAARAFAIETIASHVRRFPDLAISPEGAFDDSRDGAFSHAIVDGVLRRWFTLEFVIGLGLKQRFDALEPDLQAVLLAGAAQLLLLDRVPDHAALDESVRYAKARIRPGAGGLVNAVLRRVAELKGDRAAAPSNWADRRDLLLDGSGRVLHLQRPILPEDFTQRLSIQTSLPRGLLDRWVTAHGREVAASMALKATGPAPTILNIESDPAGGERLVTEGRAIRHNEPLAIVWKADRLSLRGVLQRERLWVQDPSSADVVRTVARLVPPGGIRTVLDLCAGQGTKTRQLARAFSQARIMAADVDRRRLAALREALPDAARVRVAHVEELGEPDAADLVLLDVPCSNSGVLARRVEARYRINAKAVGELQALQRSIVEKGLSLLRSGGILTYSTCSLEPEENQSQREWAVTTFGLELLGETRHLPAGAPGGDPTSARDGSYVAVMRSRG